MARSKGLSWRLAKMLGLVSFLLPERLFVLIARHSNQYSAALPKEHCACLTPLSEWFAADCDEGVVASDSPTPNMHFLQQQTFTGGPSVMH